MAKDWTPQERQAASLLLMEAGFSREEELTVRLIDGQDATHLFLSAGFKSFRLSMPKGRPQKPKRSQIIKEQPDKISA